MLERGQIVRFHYLWARQADAGEESGRKARPVCMVVRAPGNPGAVYLFPITKEGHEQTLRELEARRAARQ